MFKQKFTQDYYDAVDILVRDKYYDGYVCVLFDISDTFCNIDEKIAKETIKNLKLDDFTYQELIHSDYVVIEFTKYEDMEHYLFLIENELVYARFYKFGELFEEIPEDN